ncbi:hypothetical protein [Pyruvatibacter sp.]|uniref:hypothetical protein n=1 Tax=Pyruvatibacter sp. TaxID=1981328 RepID=UPI0032EC93C9
MAYEPDETGLTDPAATPDEPNTNVIEFTPSGEPTPDLAQGHTATILHLSPDAEHADTPNAGVVAAPHP